MNFILSFSFEKVLGKYKIYFILFTLLYNYYNLNSKIFTTHVYTFTNRKLFNIFNVTLIFVNFCYLMF